MKNSLKAIILGISIGLTSCSYWTGKIGNEKVFQYRGPFENSLKITKPDGKEIKYIVTYSKNKVESVEITQNKYSVTYTNNEIGKEALQVAQRQYEDYLTKILVERKRKALEDIQ